MTVDFTTDCHVHTPLCQHAVGTMEQYVLSAISKGLRGICFLEHMEEGISGQRVTWLSEDDFDLYFSEGTRLKHKYQDHIVVELGVEVGYNPECRDELLTRLEKRSWDRIGVSLHFLHPDGSSSHHLNLVSKRDTRLKQLSQQQAMQVEERYYRCLTEAVEVIPANMVCHLDGVLRYHPQRESIVPPWHIIDILLQRLKEEDVAVEINTSGIAIRGEAFPQDRLLQKITALQIPLVVGSDAHRPEDVGAGFGQVQAILQRTKPETHP